jgi:S1-C subfamily serine protease
MEPSASHLTAIRGFDTTASRSRKLLLEAPADQVGIKVGDVILAIDDHYLYTIEELNNATVRCKPGSTMKIRYRRYSMTYEMSLIVGVGEVAKTEHNSP